MRHRRTTAILCTTVAAAALATAAAATSGAHRAASDDPGVTGNSVTIGMIYDQTGPTATTQTPFAHGFQAYFDATNDAGGVAGRKIQVQTCDEKYTPDAGLTCYKQFTSSNPVFALAGSLNAGSFQPPAAPLVARDGIPVVGPQAIQQGVESSGNPHIFFTTCDYADMADVAVPFGIALTHKTKPRVAMITLNVSGGFEMSDRVQERVQKRGGTFLGRQGMGATDTDADAQAQAVAGEKPDFIVLQASSGSAVVVLKSLAKFGLSDVPVISNGPAGSPTAYQAVPQQEGKHWYFVNCFTPGDIKAPGTAKMLAAAKKYGFASDATNVNFAQGWVTGLITVAGLQRAGKNLTRQSFEAGLVSIRKLSTGDLSGDVSFGKNSRKGIFWTRPYTYNYKLQKTIQVGSYTQWAKYITHQYRPAHIG
jgi:ABC-type branched-subunit amino acid transport system substrate-binding protein